MVDKTGGYREERIARALERIANALEKQAVPQAAEPNRQAYRTFNQMLGRHEYVEWNE